MDSQQICLLPNPYVFDLLALLNMFWRECDYLIECKAAYLHLVKVMEKLWFAKMLKHILSTVFYLCFSCLNIVKKC